MTRDLDHAYDIAGQWTGPGRERAEIIGPEIPNRKRRKSKPPVPACSADGD